MSAPSTTANENASKQRREFHASAALQAANGLQKAIGIDESSYRVADGHTYPDAKAYFLYGILDEVFKAGIAIGRWGEFLSGDENPNETVTKDEHLQRVVVGWCIDEQQMWARKLTEILADLILFDGTNDQDHYRLYMACRQLDAYLGYQNDSKEFFACQNLNMNIQVELVWCALEGIGKRLNISNVWFLKAVPDRANPPRPGVIFKSARQRFKDSLKSATFPEKLALGITYEMGHSTPSRSIHPNVGGPSRESSLRLVDHYLGRVGMLCIHVAERVRQLAGISPEGLDAQFLQIFADAGRTSEMRLRRPIEVGDVVFADGADLCQVVEKVTSTYGYVSYKVRYILNPPLPNIPEDWFQERFVRLLYARNEVRTRMLEVLRKDGIPEDIIKPIENLTNDQLSRIIGQVFEDLKKAGVLERLLASS